MDFAVQRKDERDRMLGYGVWRITRNSSYRNAQFLGALQIDVVESGTTQRNQSDARSRQVLKDVAANDIIDKNTDRRRAFSTGRSLRLQPEVVKIPMQLIRPDRLAKILAVVRLGVVNCHCRLSGFHLE